MDTFSPFVQNNDNNAEVLFYNSALIYNYIFDSFVPYKS